MPPRRSADEPAYQGIGANLPPLDNAAEIVKTLERTETDLLDRAMRLEMESLKLAKTPQTDEEAAAIADHIVERRKLAKAAKDTRLETSKPYRDAKDALDAWFGAIEAPANDAVTTLTARIDVYRKAKEARLRAEQAERERIEQARLAHERAEAAEKQRLADDAQARADDAAAELANATTDADRRAAETAMRGHLETAAAAETEAQHHETAAARSEDNLVAHARAAAAPIAGALGVGSAAHGTTKWDFSVTGDTALNESLGPLGVYFTSDAKLAAIRAAIRAGVREGIPGVMIFPESKTVVRGTRASK